MISYVVSVCVPLLRTTRLCIAGERLKDIYIGFISDETLSMDDTTAKLKASGPFNATMLCTRAVGQVKTRQMLMCNILSLAR